jgi:hypothetical protein
LKTKWSEREREREREREMEVKIQTFRRMGNTRGKVKKKNTLM